MLFRSTLLTYGLGDPVSEETILRAVIEPMSEEQLVDLQKNGLSLRHLQIVAEDRDFPTAHVHQIFAVNGILFEPREVSQGDEATAKYLTALKATDSLEDLSAQLMGDGKKGIKNVSWSPAGKKG